MQNKVKDLEYLTAKQIIENATNQDLKWINTTGQYSTAAAECDTFYSVVNLTFENALKALAEEQETFYAEGFEIHVDDTNIVIEGEESYTFSDKLCCFIYYQLEEQTSQYVYETEYKPSVLDFWEDFNY